MPELLVRDDDLDPGPMEDGWRWRGAVAGWQVKLEFLCDLPDHREGKMIRPLECTNLAAANLRGTGYVARDFVWEELSGTIADGTPSGYGRASPDSRATCCRNAWPSEAGRQAQ